MFVEHRGKRPSVDPSAYVAPTAVLCGDVRVGPDSRVLFGAVVSGEDGHVEIGARCVVMENALVRGREAHPVELGDDVLVGPHAHVNGSVVGDGAFVATGATLFPGSRVGRGAEVRINAVVHVNTVLEDEAMVPIGWVAVVPRPDRRAMRPRRDLADPAGARLPPHGLRPAATRHARERMERQAEWFGAHRDDRPVD